MTNRLKELKKSLPKSKKAIDGLINCIASHSNIIDDDILIKSIKKLEADIRAECIEEL